MELLFHDGQQVAGFHDEVFHAVNLDFGAGVFRVEHFLPHLHGDFFFLVADGDDLADLGFFFRGLRQQDAAAGAGLFVVRAN